MRGAPEERLVKLPQAGKRPRQKAEALPRGELEEPGARRARKGFASSREPAFRTASASAEGSFYSSSEPRSSQQRLRASALAFEFRKPWASEKRLAQAASFVSQWRSELNRNFRRMALEFSPAANPGPISIARRWNLRICLVHRSTRKLELRREANLKPGNRRVRNKFNVEWMPGFKPPRPKNRWRARWRKTPIPCFGRPCWPA